MGVDGEPSRKLGNGPEIKAGEDDVKTRKPVWILPFRRSPLIDLLRNHHVKPVEPLEAVRAGQQIIDALHRQ